MDFQDQRQPSEIFREKVLANVEETGRPYDEAYTVTRLTNAGLWEAMQAEFEETRLKRLANENRGRKRRATPAICL